MSQFVTVARLDEIRERHPDLPIIGNGNNHFFSQLNGRMFEDFPNSSFGDLIGGMAQLETWRMNQENPLCLLNATSEEADDTTRRASWALGHFSGQYLGFDGGPWEHNHLQWSDLFEYELGAAEEPFCVEGTEILSRDYESGSGEDQIYGLTEASWATGSEAVTGEGSLLLDGPAQGWQPLVLMDLDSYGGGQEVIVSFRYHVLEAPRDGVRLYQALRGRGGDGSEKVSLPTRIVHEGEYGYVLSEGNKALASRNDYYFYLALSDGCRILIDEVRVITKRNAHILQTFDRGVLVHSLSDQPLRLDMADQWHPDPALAFTGTWYRRDRGELMLREGETLVLLPGALEGGLPSSDDSSMGSEGGGDVDARTGVPEKIQGSRFRPAFPNPFNPKVSIPFSLERETHLRAAIYDVQGRRIAEIADEVFGAGEHQLEWRGRDQQGAGVSSGIYFLRMEGGGESSVQKLILAS